MLAILPAAAILLATLGVAVVLDNLFLAIFGGDTRQIETGLTFAMSEVGPLLLSVPKVIAVAASLAIAALLWTFMALTDTGRAIRAVAKEPEGARLMGIRPDRIFALAYGIGTGCLGAALSLFHYTAKPIRGHSSAARHRHHELAQLVTPQTIVAAIHFVVTLRRASYPQDP